MKLNGLIPYRQSRPWARWPQDEQEGFENGWDGRAQPSLAPGGQVPFAEPPQITGVAATIPLSGQCIPL